VTGDQWKRKKGPRKKCLREKKCLSEDKKSPPFIPLCKRGKEGDLDRIDWIDWTDWTD
jgi:hypothetical protein